jgi:flavin reductase (DIM6/NTAB) family NADH-FMN oxidoreductase RutF
VSDGRSLPAQAIDGLTATTNYPLYVATVSSSWGHSGCLAGFVTQCSINPPRFFVCISKANHTNLVVDEHSGICLHLLGSGQRALAELFGSLTGDDLDKFDRCEWTVGTTGAPVLSHCAAWMEGAVQQSVDVGDHIAHVIDPINGALGDQDGLLTLNDVPNIDPGHPSKSH